MKSSYNETFLLAFSTPITLIWPEEVIIGSIRILDNFKTEHHRQELFVMNRYDSILVRVVLTKWICESLFRVKERFRYILTAY